MKEYYDSNGRLAHPGSTAIPEIEEKKNASSFSYMIYKLVNISRRQDIFSPLASVSDGNRAAHIYIANPVCVCVCVWILLVVEEVKLHHSSF